MALASFTAKVDPLLFFILTLRIVGIVGGKGQGPIIGFLHFSFDLKVFGFASYKRDFDGTERMLSSKVGLR